MNNYMMENYLSAFERLWKEFIQSITCNINLEDSQLYCGDRLRPQLLFWGYYIGCEYNHTQFDNESIAKLAIPFEAVHKASVIIDDIIDKDEYRKGKLSFHSQYGIETTIIFSILLLTNAIKLMQDMNLSINNDNNIILSTINTMCLGAMNELNCPKTYISIDDTLNIIQCETVELIKNCFSTGYIYSAANYGFDTEVINNVGSSIGFLFQILNDAEPFFNPQYVKSHKGKLNYDLNADGRKNSIISYLYGRCTTQELECFDNNDYIKLFELLKKYNIKNYILEQVKIKSDYIDLQLDKLDISSVGKFKKYYRQAISLGINRALGE